MGAEMFSWETTEAEMINYHFTSWAHHPERQGKATA